MTRKIDQSLERKGDNSTDHLQETNMSDLSDEEIQALIHLYESQENLFNSNLVTYHDRQAIKQSHTWISSEMKRGWTGKRSLLIHWTIS